MSEQTSQNNAEGAAPGPASGRSSRARDDHRVDGVRLLVVDPDLGTLLDADQLEEARTQVVFPSIELEPGTLELLRLRQAPGVRGKLHGFLVIEGSLTINVRMSARTCARLIGATELVLFDGVEIDSIPTRWEWSVLAPARLALLDERLLAVAHEWPKLMSAILDRAALQTRNAFLQQAISQLPKVEERLLAVFWSIADKLGTVRPEGVSLDLPVTHETLAHMVGAQRPTVSLALKRLADDGLLRAEEDGCWLIAPDSLNALADGEERERVAAAEPAAPLERAAPAS